ncbi:MAG: hypothetical protein PHZ22_02490 [Bacteroidales bacterium]|nr:hypothetical protein [Bacteroidales bacterium]MDD3911044.1 hypothetical protein [Bacteroidales bacterium]
MDIFTFPFGLREFYARPDTSISEDTNFYAPDGIGGFLIIPFIYLKISRAGKAIAKQFAPRHYSNCGHGIHICGTDEYSALPNKEEDFSYKKALYDSLDNSTFLSQTVKAEDFDFKKYATEFNIGNFNDSVEIVSKYMSLRSGDIIALELAPIAKINVKTHKNGEAAIYGDLKISVIC